VTGDGGGAASVTSTARNASSPSRPATH